MKTAIAREIIACLPRNRTLFHYYKDYYAAYLLQREIRYHGCHQVSDLKQGRYRNLTRKPLIKSLLAQCGSGEIKVSDFDLLWGEGCETYVLTLGTWGRARDHRYYQTSRPGKNLVLQLNFCNRHDQQFERCIGSDMDRFRFYCHPISRRRTTLAWARIDIDLDTNEALIEEIQCDWLKEADDLQHFLKLAVRCKHKAFRYYGQKIYVDRAFQYLWSEMDRHRSVWSEATLNAAIKFLLEEIGIKTVYYHSFATGTAIKRIKLRKPPRSLYTRLPNQFCFEAVKKAPQFLWQDKHARRRLRAIGAQQWFRMEA